MTNFYETIPSDAIIEKTAAALRQHGMTVHIVDRGSDAKTLLKAFTTISLPMVLLAL